MYSRIEEQQDYEVISMFIWLPWLNLFSDLHLYASFDIYLTFILSTKRMENIEKHTFSVLPIKVKLVWSGE